MYDKVTEPQMLCAVESILKIAVEHHRNIQILIHTSNVSNMRSALRRVLKSPLVKIKHLNLQNLFECTILRRWYKVIEPIQYELKNQHLPDAIRLALLYKYGGLYLDMDVLTLTPRLVDFLLQQQNGVVWSQTKERLEANGAMHYAPLGNRFVRRMMSEFVVKYNYQSWPGNGPIRVAETIDLCENNPQLDCNDVILMPMGGSESFEWQNVVQKFQLEDHANWKIDRRLLRKKLFFFHWFHHMWVTHRVLCFPNRSIITKTFRTYCPQVSRVYGSRIFCQDEEPMIKSAQNWIHHGFFFNLFQ